MNNEHLVKFLELMKWLKSNGESLDTTLGSKLRQVALSEKKKTEEFFTNVIDQPAFDTLDHRRLRSFLIDWYSTHRTTLTQCRETTDPYALSSDVLNELIKSFGFPYPEMITSTAKKSFFLTDLINLLKNKGTPATFVNVLQTYFGLSNVVMSEWWIHKLVDGNFVARTKPVFPGYYKYNPQYKIELPYDNFIESNPFWHLNKTGNDTIENLYSNNEITLPSLTSQISLQAAINFSTLSYTTTILTRKLEEAYNFWVETGNKDNSITLRNFEGNFAFIDLFLAVIYLFDEKDGTTDTNKRVLYYSDSGDHAPLDKENSEGVRNGIDDVDYSIIIDEYNNLTRRPKTRTERDMLLEERNEKFTIATDSTSINFISLINNPGTFLNSINPDFKESIDTLVAAGVTKDELLEDLLTEFESFVNYKMEIFNYNLTSISLGMPISVKLEPIIDFFKPFHVHLRDFLVSFLIDDPLENCVISDDYLKLFINQKLYDQNNVSDALKLFINQKLYETYTINDYLSTKVIQTSRETVSMSDEMNNLILKFIFTDSGNYYGNIDNSLVQDYVTIPLIHSTYSERYRGDLDSGPHEQNILKIISQNDELINIIAEDYLKINLDFEEIGFHDFDNNLVNDEVSILVTDTTSSFSVELINY
jgi:hypothetical protein